MDSPFSPEKSRGRAIFREKIIFQMYAKNTLFELYPQRTSMVFVHLMMVQLLEVPSLACIRNALRWCSSTS
jgi:hypothetical protein